MDLIAQLKGALTSPPKAGVITKIEHGLMSVATSDGLVTRPVQVGFKEGDRVSLTAAGVVTPLLAVSGIKVFDV
ncbi:MAG: hypothetical protein PHP00_06945 [Thiotrichaceae bacterium]|nr:hypothetical protein [Thiotrichaceae bacterium]